MAFSAFCFASGYQSATYSQDKQVDDDETVPAGPNYKDGGQRRRSSLKSSRTYLKELDFDSMPEENTAWKPHSSQRGAISSRMPWCFDNGEVRCATALKRQWGNMLIKAVRRGIARYDTISIGVPVKLSGVSFNPFSGRMELDNVVIMNPQGYQSEFLARAHQVVVFVNMKKLITSKGKFVELHRVEIHKLELIYEKDMFSESNIDHVMNFIEGEEAVEAGYLQRGIQNVAHTVARTVAHATNFVTTEARHVVDDVAPAPIRRMFSIAEHTAEGVLDTATAVAGTTVAATTAAIEGATRVTADTAKRTTLAAGSAARSAAKAIGDAAEMAEDAVAQPFRRNSFSALKGSGPRGRPSLTGTTSISSVRRRLSLQKSSEDANREVVDEEEAEEEQDEWFLLHRLIATDISVRVASTTFRGAGMKLYVPDIDLEDCAEEVEFDHPLNVARFVIRSLLETVHQKVTYDLSFALDVARQGSEAVSGATVAGG